MIEFRKNTRYQILTPDGYRDFSGMRRTTKSEVVNFWLSNGKTLQASLDHKFIINGELILAKDIQEGQPLSSDILVTRLQHKEGKFLLYDPTDVGGGHLFLADGVVSHNCDFLASGETVFEPEYLSFYEQTYQKDPNERRGVDSNLWIWEYPDYTKSYMVIADVARGDGADYSTFHIIDVENVTQIGEYRSKVSPRDFGNILVGIASEYNNALLVVENASMGWATIEQILEREYPNLYYSSRSDQDTVESYMSKYERGNLVPGFTMSMKTRPLVISKMMEYIRDKSVTIQSKRLLEEMRVFVWKNGKAQAQSGYNDDLIIAFATGLYVRDTALRLRQQGMDLARAQLSSFSNLNNRQAAVYNVGNMKNNPYNIDTPYGQEDISWLLR